MDTLGLNISFPIKKADGTPFHNLVMHKSTYDSVVMSLGDKITGDVYYKDNTLTVTMQEYIEYKGVHYVLVNPPTVVREGMVADNSDLRGMTKYSFTFYHPMVALGNMSFNDVAVSSDQLKYLSQNNTFSWIGNCFDFIAKLNKNLQGSQWVVVSSGNEESEAKMQKLSDVLSFDKQYISDALKKAYETWEVPFVIDSLHEGEYFHTNNSNQQVDYYTEGKRYVIVFGLPSNEILDENDEEFVFQFGKGVGLKNNSRNPKNNKIVTRLAGRGSENNIPYGYPQIPWYGNPNWEYTVNNDSTATGSYPIYKGIYGGQYIKLIKHPFTRKTLMPTVYAQTLFNKVSPYLSNGTANPDFDPDTTIIDYYDADSSYPNPIVLDAPSYEIHQFDDIKPELGEKHIIGWDAYDDKEYISYSEYQTFVQATLANTSNVWEQSYLQTSLGLVTELTDDWSTEKTSGSTTQSLSLKYNAYDGGKWFEVQMVSPDVNFKLNVYVGAHSPSYYTALDDTMDDNGEYVQSYFQMTIPQLDFDLYACAAITEEMQINMRSGACIGCTFNVMVDWEDYKKNFYDADGNFVPNGSQRDLTKYPKSNLGQITLVLQKDINTFGTILPDIYRQPKGETSTGANDGDQFVILGISLPVSYVTNAQTRLDDAMMEYMLENNVYYYDYPLKFDEHFLATHTDILAQMRNNTIVTFRYGNEPDMKLYIKQMSVKFGDTPLPQYDITLTDDVEIVLNQIGQVTDDVSRMRVEISELQKYYGQNIQSLLDEKLSRVADDVAQGKITFQQGLNSLMSAVFADDVRSQDFVSGMYSGRGWRIDNLGNAEMESLRVRSVLEVIELLVNRLQAQEGDTLFSDNDQIEKVDVVTGGGGTSYILSLKEKWDGYITSQMYGNILKGIINTLAAKEGGVSDESSTSVEVDGANKYYTSWMRVTATHNTDNTLGVNQIRVVLFSDSDTPAQKNFAPCELMTFARWGCIDYSSSDASQYAAEGLSTAAAIAASIKKRQTVFYISSNEGRIVKLTGVNKPIIEDGNYGMVFGVIPDFIRQWDSWERLVREHPHLEDRDYLYAQGLIYQDLVKVDITGAPVPVTVYCGDWVDGSQMQNPTIGNGIYFNVGWNDTTKQFERHTARHSNGTWMCLQNQPVTVQGVTTYYEPKWGSDYWMLIDGNGNYSIEFESTMGSSFYVGHVGTTITPHLYYGNVDISADIDVQYWSWTRSTESGSTAADTIWNNNHKQMRILTLTDEDMPTGWGRNNKAIFTCTVVVNDGSNQVIIQNQVIA